MARRKGRDGMPRTVPPPMVDPYSVRCPTCNAKPHEPCTVATDTGRRKMAHTHFAREDAAIPF